MVIASSIAILPFIVRDMGELKASSNAYLWFRERRKGVGCGVIEGQVPIGRFNPERRNHEAVTPHPDDLSESATSSTTIDHGKWYTFLTNILYIAYVSCHLKVPITSTSVIFPFIGCKTVIFCLTSSASELDIVRTSKYGWYTNTNPTTFDSITFRGSSSIPTLVMAKMECCNTTGDSSRMRSTSAIATESS